EIIRDQATGTWEQKRYLGGVLIITLKSNGGGSKEYLFTDHLGSTDVISDRFGNLLQQMSFDAFGARRNPATTASPWVTLPILGQQNFDTSHTTHGYTGHEGADKVGLIHMNGRMYDPVLGRFIQADSIVQDPYDPQSLNRYAYVLNNPLTATDPSGNISFKNALKLVAVVAITVFTGGAAAGSFAFIGTLTAAQGFAVVVAGGALSGAIMGGAKGALRGAFTAAVFFGVGQGANALQGAKGTLSHAAFANSGLGRAALHGVAGGALASLQGGNFGHAFLTAGIGKAITSNVPQSGNDYADGALAALVGGTISEATGEGFSNGALTGAMQFAFNGLLGKLGKSLVRTVKGESPLGEVIDAATEGAEEPGSRLVLTHEGVSAIAR
ncbi:MAG: hypothetical protein GW900_08550, partial [Gammaproteobacteria bacterium]|nr:hypothetical protein [Gammaproteobacteria bacterium]